MYVYVPVQSHYDYANLPNVHVNNANAFNAFNEPSISFGPPSISVGMPSIRYAPLQVQVRPPVPPVTLSHPGPPPIVRPLALVAPTLAPRPKPRPRMVAPPVRSSLAARVRPPRPLLAGRARPPRPSCKEDFIMLGISDGSKPDDPYGNRKALASSSKHSDKLETWDSLHQKWEKQKVSLMAELNSQPSRLSPNHEPETSDDEDGNTKDLVIQETQDVLRRYLGERSHKRAFGGLITYLYGGYNPFTKHHGHLSTLPETNSLPLNRPGPKRKRSPSSHPFSGLR